MSDKTGIEWTDATWNPVTGCTKVSAGCDHCYAETLHERFHGKGSFATVNRSEEKLYLPLKWRKPRKVFVNSMSDLFHDDVPDSFIARVFEVMARTPQHTYQILTKRHARMRSLLNRPSFRDNLAHWGTWPLPNVWLGVSVETQQWADIRIPALLDTPAAVRWISAEPLLGPVDLRDVAGIDSLMQDWTGGSGGGSGAPHPLLDWVVVGGESGRQARPMHPQWARSLRDQCGTAGVPFLFKQWGEWTAMAQPGDQWAERGPDTYVNEADGCVADEDTAIAAGGSWMGVYRVGKGKAGRELDRQYWDQYPAVTV